MGWPIAAYDAELNLAVCYRSKLTFSMRDGVRWRRPFFVQAASVGMAS